MTLYKFLPRKLDVQVAVICGILMAVMLPIYVINEVNDEIDYVVSTKLEETRIVAKNISQTSTKYLLIRDYTSLDSLLLNSANYPGVLDLQIIDLEGRVVSDVVVEDSVVNSRYDLNVLIPPQDNLIYKNDKELTIWEPVSSGSLVGWVRFNYSLESTYQHAYERMYDFLINAGVLVLMLIVLLLLFLRKPMSLLGKAAEFANEISNKTGDVMPVAYQSVELEKITSALNDASESLFHQEQKITEVLKDLETQKKALDEHSIVSITDENGYIFYANDKFLEVTGYENNEVIGKKHDIVKSGIHTNSFYRDMWDTVKEGKIWKGEVCNLNKSGQMIWMSTSIVPFMNEAGMPYKFVEISTDITKKKHSETELEQKNKILKELTEHLEDIVHKRTSELEKANEELVSLNNIKSEFVSVVSHELRTPLTSIKSFAEILEDDIDEMSKESRQRYLRIINDEADRLGRLINDVLDLQKIDSGLMHWRDEVTDLKLILENSYSLFLPAFNKKGVALTIDIPPGCFDVAIDSDRMMQVLSNVLSNALKFTHEGVVAISLSSAETNNNKGLSVNGFEVVVADSGIGIPDDEIEKVFCRFHQVDSSETRKEGGSGLGLNICKEIIEHYHGCIWVEHNEPKGSCFKFILPEYITVKDKNNAFSEGVELS